jgi:SAM-dependent methyltransferase
MPTIEQQVQTWDANYVWSERGEEWSEAWGGSEAQWFSAIYPRIHAFLPAATVLEIAPGFGRWTNYLKNYCQDLYAVDLAEACINFCQERFAASTHISYHVNDGKSLAMIPDSTLDFVFSFDSLVHAEADVLQVYLEQLAKKLKPNGIGFIHHSNMGEYRETFEWYDKLPDQLRGFLLKRGWIDPRHWRAYSMTAGLFEQYCKEVGLQCISQEIINWGSKRLIDCFSTFTLPGSVWSRQNIVTRNAGFMDEATAIRQLAPLYSFLPKRSA